MSRRSPLLSWIGLISLSVTWGTATAATPIEFPSSERDEEWASALVLGDFYAGTATGSIWVRVEATEPQWSLSVRDRSGQIHRVRIDPPETMADREALVLLAASLIEPSASRQLPGLALPTAASSSGSERSPSSADQGQSSGRQEGTEERGPVPAEPGPQPDSTADADADADSAERASDSAVVAATIEVEEVDEAIPPEDPAMELEPVSTRDPESPSERDPESLSARDPEEPSPPLAPLASMEDVLAVSGGSRWSLRTGVGAASRTGLELSPLGEVGIAWDLPRVQLAALVRGIPSSDLELIEGERTVASGEVWTEAGRSLSRLYLGVGAGLRASRFEDGPAGDSSWVWGPTSAVVLGLRVVDLEHLSCRADASLGMDLSRIQLRIDDVDRAEFPRTHASVRWTIQRQIPQ